MALEKKPYQRCCFTVHYHEKSELKRIIKALPQEEKASLMCRQVLNQHVGLLQHYQFSQCIPNEL